MPPPSAPPAQKHGPVLIHVPFERMTVRSEATLGIKQGARHPVRLQLQREVDMVGGKRLVVSRKVDPGKGVEAAAQASQLPSCRAIPAEIRRAP